MEFLTLLSDFLKRSFFVREWRALTGTQKGTRGYGGNEMRKNPVILKSLVSFVISM